jgi:hypothetical protein
VKTIEHKIVELAESAWLYLTDRGSDTRASDPNVTHGYGLALLTLDQLARLRQPETEAAKAWVALAQLDANTVRALLLIAVRELAARGFEVHDPDGPTER